MQRYSPMSSFSPKCLPSISCFRFPRLPTTSSPRGSRQPRNPLSQGKHWKMRTVDKSILDSSVPPHGILALALVIILPSSIFLKRNKWILRLFRLIHRILRFIGFHLLLMVTCGGHSSTSQSRSLLFYLNDLLSFGAVRSWSIQDVSLDVTRGDLQGFS